MASKDISSKTARVMSLLSKKPAPAPEEKSAAPESPIVASASPDTTVSVQIKSALEDALEGELETRQTQPLPAAKPTPEPEPVAEEAEFEEDVFEDEEAELEEMEAEFEEEAELEEVEAEFEEEAELEEVEAEFEEEAELEEEAESGEEAELEEEAPAEGEHKWSTHALPRYPGYINVMQMLVEEKAPKYVKMFGLCTCERCMEDVKALTLNHLPSKYVVLEPGDLVPRLTVYENKFSSDITAQLLHACKLVMEHPHHSR